MKTLHPPLPIDVERPAVTETPAVTEIVTEISDHALEPAGCTNVVEVADMVAEPDMIEHPTEAS